MTGLNLRLVADLRPIRYETGACMAEGGKIFLTASIRMQEGAYQGMQANLEQSKTIPK